MRTMHSTLKFSPLLTVNSPPVGQNEPYGTRHDRNESDSSQDSGGRIGTVPIRVQTYRSPRKCQCKPSKVIGFRNELVGGWPTLSFPLLP